MRVSIIGIQGVGMAHAIACVRLGWEVVAVLDTDPRAERRLHPPWVNAWGPYRDEVIPTSRPVFTTDIVEFQSVLAHVLIISCPTEFHIAYLYRIGGLFPMVLVEKPLTLTPQNVPTRDTEAYIAVGHEWLCHPRFPKALVKNRWIRQGHNFPPTEPHKSDPGVVWDLGVHSVAAALKFIPEELWSECNTRPIEIRPEYARLDVVHPRIDPIHIEVGYQSYGDGEVCVGGEMLHWDEGIFERQLVLLSQRSHPAPFNLGLQACRLLRGL